MVGFKYKPSCLAIFHENAPVTADLRSSLRLHFTVNCKLVRSVNMCHADILPVFGEQEQRDMSKESCKWNSKWGNERKGFLNLKRKCGNLFKLLLDPIFFLFKQVHRFWALKMTLLCLCVLWILGPAPHLQMRGHWILACQALLKTLSISVELLRTKTCVSVLQP